MTKTDDDKVLATADFYGTCDICDAGESVTIVYFDDGTWASQCDACGARQSGSFEVVPEDQP